MREWSLSVCANQQTYERPFARLRTALALNNRSENDRSEMRIHLVWYALDTRVQCDNIEQLIAEQELELSDVRFR
jgi:hypothetical protein